MNSKSNHDRGFTLIEILIALGIGLVLTTVVLSVFMNFRSYQALDKDVGLIVEVIRQAKSLTLNSKNSSQYGVHFESGSITIFTGASYSSTSPTNLVHTFNSGVSATTTLTGSVRDIVFKRLSGETDNNGTIVLSSQFSTTTKTITVYKTGLVE